MSDNVWEPGSRQEFPMKPGSKFKMHNTTTKAFHLSVATEDGTRLRFLVIPGHAMEITVGMSSPDVTFLDDGDDLIGTPA